MTIRRFLWLPGCPVPAIWARDLRQAIRRLRKRRPRRNNTQEADETARFLLRQRAVTLHNYRNRSRR